MRQEGDEVLKPAEAARRLGQRILALGDGRAGGGMAARQIEADGAQVGEGGEVGHGVIFPWYVVIAGSQRVRPEVAGPMTSSATEAIQKRRRETGLLQLRSQ